MCLIDKNKLINIIKYYKLNIIIIIIIIINHKMSSKNKYKKKYKNINDYDYFTLKYGSDIMDLVQDLKGTADHNGVDIFRSDFTGDLLEDFIFNNCLIRNPNSKCDYDYNRKHNYDTDDIILRK